MLRILASYSFVAIATALLCLFLGPRGAGVAFGLTAVFAAGVALRHMDRTRPAMGTARGTTALLFIAWVAVAVILALLLTGVLAVQCGGSKQPLEEFDQRLKRLEELVEKLAQ
jgi:hypothetical protein